MKRSTRILSFVLAMMMLFSAFSVLASAREVEVAQTSATVSSDGTARLYFNMAAVSWWTTASAGGGNYAYFFNNSTGKYAWSTKAVAYSGNTYYVTMPAGDWAGVILTRNSVTSGPSWSNKWNQTGDITLSSTSNYISKFSADSTSVTWGTAVKPASTVSLTASKTEIGVGGSATLNATLASNATLNKIASVTYSATNGTVENGVYTANTVGEDTVTATVTYYPNCYSSLTSTATATVNITVTEDGDTSTEVPTEAPTEAPTEPPTEAPTVVLTTYCINSAGWDTLSAHGWVPDGIGTAWPGEAMTKTGEVDKNGFDVYSVTFSSPYENVIFNNTNNGKQTADLTLMEGQYFDLKTGAWYATLDDVPSLDPLSTNRYILGTFNEWNALSHEFKLDAEGSSTGYISIDLEANTTYEFKVIREDAWTSNTTPITGDVSGLVFSSSTSGNATITTKAAGTYVFSFGMNNSQLSVTYPVEVTEAPTEAPTAEYTYTYELTSEQVAAGINYEVVYNSDVFTLQSVDYGYFEGTDAVTNSAVAGRILLNNTTQEDSMDFTTATNVITAVFVGPVTYDEADAPKMYIKELYNVDALLEDMNVAYSYVETFGDVVNEGSVEAQAPTAMPTEAPTEAPTDPVQICEPGYYLVGTLGGVDCWSIESFTADRKLNENVGSAGEYMLDYTFTLGDEVKVAYTDGYTITAWYNDGGKNYNIGDTKVGEGTIYFRPEGNADWSYFYFTVIPKNPATPDEPTEAPTNPPVDEYITVYFQNNWMWSDVCVYTWNVDTEIPVAAWPGTPMEFYANDGTYDIYKAEIPVGYGVIFNGLKDDGSGDRNQSPDILDAVDGRCYYMKWDDVNAKNDYGFEPIDVMIKPATDDEATPDEPATEPPVVCEPGYYLVGTLNGVDCWSLSDSMADRMLVANPGAEGEYMLNYTFTLNDEIKVVYTADGATITKWYNDGGKNYTIGEAKVGEGTLYFRPEGNTEWSYEWFTVIPNTPATDDEATPDEPTEAPTNPPVDEYITVYFQNNWMWSDVCVYTWNVDTEIPVAAWPGTPMELYANDGTYDIYVAQIPAGYGVIFNGLKDDGSGDRNQSPDILDAVDGRCYYMKWDDVNAKNDYGFEPIENMIKPATDDEATPDEPATEPPVVCEPGYYLVGTLNGVDCWSLSDSMADRMLVANPGAEGEYMLEYTFTLGDEIKVVYTADGATITKWYNDGGDNYTIGEAKVGEGTLYFRPEGNADWSYEWFTVVPKNPATPDEPVPTEPVETKTVYVGVIEWITDYVPTLHYWNNETGLAGDATLTATGETVAYAVGADYWSGAAQNFTVYTAEVPVTATAMKTWNGTTSDCWAEEEVAVADGTILLLFEYGNVYHNISATYPPVVEPTEPEATPDEPATEPETEPETEPTEPETEPETEPTEPETEPETEPTEPETEPAPAKPIKVENFSYTSTANTISLSWEAAEGAYKYWIYKLNEETGVWSIAASTYETSGIVKFLSPNTTYQLKVIGKFQDDGSYMSLDNADAFAATTAPAAAPGEVSLTAGLNEATISWDAVEGATKYWVYKASSLDGPWYIAWSTTETSAVMQNLRNDMTYYFRIASLTYQNGVPCISDYMDSPYVSVETPKSEDITTMLDINAATTATISWNAIEGAEKYWIMYSTTTTDTTQTAQWTTAGTATDVTVFNMRKLTANTVYHVFIRARYTDALGAVKTYDYIPVTFRTAYSDDPFITFGTQGNYTTFAWPEDITDIQKTWVYVYDAQGNQMAMMSTTTNSGYVKTFEGIEDCYVELKVLDVNGYYGYLTPSGGEHYHN